MKEVTWLIKLSLMLFLVLSCQFIYGATVATPEVASDVIKIKAMRINNTLTHDETAEVFMDLENTGNFTHVLVAAYSPLAKKVQFHETINHDKHMMMHRVHVIAVASHKDQDLHFDGLHMMLIGLNQSLKNHEEVPVTLIFNDGSWLIVNARVFTAPATI